MTGMPEGPGPTAGEGVSSRPWYMRNAVIVAGAVIILFIFVFGLAAVAPAPEDDPELASSAGETPAEVVTEVVTETATETVTETATEVVTERPTGQVNRLRRQVQQKDQTISRLRDRVNGLRDRVNGLESQLAAAPDTDSGSAPVYYENCDAARAAGEAPVRRGDPGYGPHLDADNDGVGCES